MNLKKLLLYGTLVSLTIMILINGCGASRERISLDSSPGVIKKNNAARGASSSVKVPAKSKRNKKMDEDGKKEPDKKASEEKQDISKNHKMNHLAPGVKVIKKEKKNKPAPLLDFSILRVDKKKRLILNAGESIGLIVKIDNQGNGLAEQVKIKISGLKKEGIKFSNSDGELEVGVIYPGQQKNILFQVRVHDGINDKRIPLVLEVKMNSQLTPSVYLFQVYCRSLETYFFDMIKQRKSIKKCEKYISRFPDGKHVAKVKKILDELRWKKIQKIYLKAVNSGTVKDETIEEVKKNYPMDENSKELRTHFKEVSKIIAEMREFQAVSSNDTYMAYKKFKDKFKKRPLAAVARKRATLKYWAQREKKETENPHTWCQLAQALIEEKGVLGYREAKEYFVKTIQKKPDNKTAYIGIGKILVAMKNYKECIQYLQKKRPEKIKHYKIYYYLGYAYEQLENHDMALFYYSTAIKSLEFGINTIDNPEKQQDYLKCLYYRALLYKTGLYIIKAKKDFAKIIELAPGSQWATDAKVYLNEMD